MDAHEEEKKPENGPKYVRWYDRQQTLSKSVKLLEAFPIAYQEILGEAIISLASKHGNAHELMVNLRVLGPEKVLNLFKAKSKSRSYDRNETVHKAMNYLYVLPDEGRVFIATQVIEVIEHLYEYFSICRETGQAPDKAVVQSLSQAYIQGQLQDTVEHLTQFYPSMNLPNGPTLRSIQARRAKARSQAFEPEKESFKSKQIIVAKRLLQPALPDPVTPPLPAPSSSAEASDHHQQTAEPATPTGVKQTTDDTSQAETTKDETLAQDNRGMKIRLDKFDL